MAISTDGHEPVPAEIKRAVLSSTVPVAAGGGGWCSVQLRRPAGGCVAPARSQPGRYGDAGATAAAAASLGAPSLGALRVRNDSEWPRECSVQHKSRHRPLRIRAASPVVTYKLQALDGMVAARSRQVTTGHSGAARGNAARQVTAGHCRSRLVTSLYWVSAVAQKRRLTRPPRLELAAGSQDGALSYPQFYPRRRVSTVAPRMLRACSMGHSG